MGAINIKRLSLVIAGALMIAFTSACSRSSGGADGSAGSIYNPDGAYGNFGYGTQGCGNCGSATQYALTALGQGDSGYARHVQLGLDIFLDPAYIYTPDGSMMYVFQSYPSGAPVGASGELEVVSDYSSCAVPPGVYQVTTVQPGQYLGSNQFRNMVLQGQNTRNGAVITLALNSTSNNYITYLTNPSVSYNGIPYNYKIQKTMTIVSIGGYPCSGGTYELY